MFSMIADKLNDAHFMTMLLAAIAASATAYTLLMPLFAGEGLVALRRRKYEKRCWAKVHYPVSRCRKLRPKLRLWKREAVPLVFKA